MSIYVNKIATIAGEAADAQMKYQVLRFSKQVNIDNANATSVYIRNIGPWPMSGDEIHAYVNNQLVACSPPLSLFEPNSMQICNFRPACALGGRIKVSAPANSEEMLC